MNRIMVYKDIVSIAEENDWNIHVNELKSEYIQFEFSKFTPAGQDFNFSAELRGKDLQTLVKSIKERYDNFDPDEEAYLWIGADGHGRNGAPYHIKDIVDDMIAAKEMIYQLYVELSNAA